MAQYDVDIQVEKRKFAKWIRSRLYHILFGVVGLLILMLIPLPGLQRDIFALDIQSWITIFYSTGLFWIFWYYNVKKIFTFQCPNPKCNKPVSPLWRWTCPFCPKRRVNLGFEYSFFDRCKNCNRPPPSYQCGNCGFVFELIPGGNLHTYAHLPGVSLPPVFPDVEIEKPEGSNTSL